MSRLRNTVRVKHARNAFQCGVDPRATNAVPGTTSASATRPIHTQSVAPAAELVACRRGKRGYRSHSRSSGSADVNFPRSMNSFSYRATVTFERVCRFAAAGAPLWQAAQCDNVPQAIAAYKHSVCAAQSLQECDICWVCQWNYPGASIAYSAGVLLSTPRV